MNFYLQSRSGNHNCVFPVEGLDKDASKEQNLKAILRGIRADGGYTVTDRSGRMKMIPFEEIEFIREAEEGD